MDLKGHFSQETTQPGTMVHVCNPSTVEVEAGRFLPTQGQPKLQCETLTFSQQINKVNENSQHETCSVSVITTETQTKFTMLY